MPGRGIIHLGFVNLGFGIWDLIQGCCRTDFAVLAKMASRMLQQPHTERYEKAYCRRSWPNQQIPNPKSQIGVHAGRTFGGHHDHRHFDCAVAAGGAGGAGGRATPAMHQQSETDRPGVPRARADAGLSAHRRLGRLLGRRADARLRSAAAQRLDSTTSCPTSNFSHCTTWGSTRARTAAHLGRRSPSAYRRRSQP